MMADRVTSETLRAGFTRVGAKDNFYQTSSFIPMSFGLVTTVYENGETGIGPHALLYPFGIVKPHSMLLISRGTSGTASNIRRTGKCALNYIEFDRDVLQGVSNLGYPGRALEDKQHDNPFTMVDSPSADKADDPDFPEIIGEAFQVFECTWDDSVNLDQLLGVEEAEQGDHFVLRIDNILIRDDLVDAIEDGDKFPNMPIFYGFRANGEFWFAEHNEPFAVPLPQVKGTDRQGVFYLANRLDENVRFTDEACEALTGIPRPFLKEVLKGIIDVAIEKGATEVDEALLEEINKERNQS